MARFKTAHLVPEGTVEHVMRGIVLAPDVDPHPVVLILKHAGKANERFTKARNNALAKGRHDEQTTIQIFARTVIEGWRHVYDEHGQPVPFSPDEAEALLLALLDAKRDEAVAAAIDKASDAARFAEREDLGKG